jgi:hypothetical protein
MTLLPAGLALAGDRDKPIFPIMPVFLSLIFVYLLWKGFKARRADPEGQISENIQKS